MVVELTHAEPARLSFRLALEQAVEKSPNMLKRFLRSLVPAHGDSNTTESDQDHGLVKSPSSGSEAGNIEPIIQLGKAALDAFLRTNVTGPVLLDGDKTTKFFVEAFTEGLPEEAQEAIRNVSGRSKHAKKTDSSSIMEVIRTACLRSLDTDGVSAYEYAPHIELFALARWLFISGEVLPGSSSRQEGWEIRAQGEHAEQEYQDETELAILRLRVHVWHFKLLSQPSLGPGSIFTKGGRWTDIATLQERVEKSLEETESLVFGGEEENDDDLQSVVDEGTTKREGKINFLLEKANAYIMLHNEAKAKEALKRAAECGGFVYQLYGALGKRTKWQEKNISQLVVLAKSADTAVNVDDQSNGGGGGGGGGRGGGHGAADTTSPQALSLNDDTLLEKISFSEVKSKEGKKEKVDNEKDMSPALRDLKPDEQPPLKPEDQIILLTEATIRDTFSPADTLTAEQILPFAVRVIDDGSRNWQIYTQALLVRSRIELGRSRTVERGVLQIQAVVDQVVADTSSPEPGSGLLSESEVDNDGVHESVPSIEVSTPDGPAEAVKPTSFLPAPKPSESASAETRLRYIHTLSSPPRWHLESELAYAWTSVGSLGSALEIFKRLRLWAEVALCLATAGAADDENGRGSGGEDKARALIRWRLFRRTGTSGDSDEQDEEEMDIDSLRLKDWYGPERQPAPPNAPRLFCILGDMENEPSHYLRAWEVSKHRFARAQRSLGDLYLQKSDLESAVEAYQEAVKVNRLSAELWTRLGDIELKLGRFPDAVGTFRRAIAHASAEEGGEGARTWSNLGTALVGWWRGVMKELELELEKDEDDGNSNPTQGVKSAQPKPLSTALEESNKPARQLLTEALAAFKKGATAAATNWRIWDNVVTLGLDIAPRDPRAWDDVVLGMHNILRIRAQEDAIDVEVLGRLVREVITSSPQNSDGEKGTDQGRALASNGSSGTLARRVGHLVEHNVVPLLTVRSDIWTLVSRLRAWQGDFSGAVDAAEKAWRAAMNPSSSSVLTASNSSDSGGRGRIEEEGGEKSRDWRSGASREAWDEVVQRACDLVAAYENWGTGGGEGDGEAGKWKGKARAAVRSVMGKGKEAWEGREGWYELVAVLDGLR